jgi:ATP-dependent DNA ligase
MTLPIQPPYPPMEALLVEKIPAGDQWQYEPKWDGFRCLLFRDGRDVQLQSKAGQPLARYFPELVQAVLKMKPQKFVLDGEIAVPIGQKLDFDQLLMRIHPAASRIQKLAGEHPAIFIAFDLLVDAGGTLLVHEALQQRRARLGNFARIAFSTSGSFHVSPATTDLAAAKQWLSSSGSDIDGVVAKRLEMDYRSGERIGMVKIKPVRTVDCVVGGFRHDKEKKSAASLLLGLYDHEGLLHHVGFCSSFKAAERRLLLPKLAALIQPPGFTGRSPGGPSRWNAGRSVEWQPLRPELVVEVAYDHFTGGRFRHGAKFVRWRPDKSPRQCLLDQVSKSRDGSYSILRDM